MTIIHSSDLGWTAGQDISQAFAAIAKTLQPGDVFVFDHMYEITGSNIRLADNVTLAGGAPGAGFDIQDVETNGNYLLELGNGNKLVDLTIKHGSTPNTDNHKTSIKADGYDIQIINSSFEGNPKVFVFAEGDNLSVVDTVFDGAYYQMRWFGECTNFTVENSLFQNSVGDGIKTARHGGGTGEGTQNATISNSVFINNARDGIDTTGGFKDSSITDSYFVNNKVSALDFKKGFRDQSDFSENLQITNVDIRNTEFIGDESTLIVTTLLNRFNFEDVDKYAPNNIHIYDSIFENTNATGGIATSWLLKNGHSLTSTNNEYLGKIRIDPLHNSESLTVTGSTVGPARTPEPDSYYQSLTGPDWSDISYPTDGTANPPSNDSVVTPEPIYYDPTPDPTPTPDVEVSDPEPDVDVEDTTPTVDEPVVTPAPEELILNAVSNTLNVFLAYTDTDKKLVQLGEGSSVASSLIEGRPLTIYAESQEGAPAIGSVKLEVPGLKTQIENAEPYALFGDNKGDFSGDMALAEGEHTVKLTVYEGKNGSGTVLETVSFDFTVEAHTTQVDSVVSEPEPEPVVVEPAPEPEPIPEPETIVVVTPEPEAETDLARDTAPFNPDSQLIEISLIDTFTDKVVTGLSDGIKLSSDDLGGRKLTISAEAFDPDTANIGSMKLEMGSYSRIENVAPYALFGDNAKGNFLGGQKLAEGTHTATLTTYSGKKGTGSVLEEVTIQFEIGDYDSVIIDGTPGTVSSYSSKQDKGTAAVSNDQTSIELEASAWKSLTHFKEITEMTVMKIDYKSDVEGEIQGIGFSNGSGSIKNTFFQLGGSQQLGIQDFNGDYVTGSGFDTVIIPVGEFFTGDFDELVLINDDDAGFGSSSVYDNISFYEAVA